MVAEKTKKLEKKLFKTLKEINTRPLAFEFYTADELWTNEHTAKQMLEYHLNEAIDISSRNHQFIEDSVEWITARFGIGSESTIADFGCGPGLYTIRMAEKGAAVTGIDFSANSLNYAKRTAQKKQLSINYIQANYLDYSTTERFDLITMIMCDFCALSPDQREILIKKFHSFLKPGGAILLDVYSLISFAQRQESASYELNHLNGFWSPDKYYCFVNTFKYDTEKVILDKYTIIEESQHRVVYNWLQYFSQESLCDEFKANGFLVESLYADVAGKPITSDSPEIAIVVRKK